MTGIGVGKGVQVRDEGRRLDVFSRKGASTQTIKLATAKANKRASTIASNLENPQSNSPANDPTQKQTNVQTIQGAKYLL